jgi:hypothetical protein
MHHMTTQTAQEHRIAAERAAEATRWDEAALSLMAAGDAAVLRLAISRQPSILVAVRWQPGSARL